MVPYKGGNAEHKSIGHTCTVCSWVIEMEEAPFGKTSDILMAMWLADCAAGLKRRKGAPRSRVYSATQIDKAAHKREKEAAELAEAA